jgi:hypothetical protein
MRFVRGRATSVVDCRSTAPLILNFPIDALGTRIHMLGTEGRDSLTYWQRRNVNKVAPGHFQLLPRLHMPHRRTLQRMAHASYPGCTLLFTVALSV